jgi:hypothetical protein
LFASVLLAAAVGVPGLNASGQMLVIPARPACRLMIIAVDVVALSGCAPTAAAPAWKLSSPKGAGRAAGTRDVPRAAGRGGREKTGRGQSAVKVARAARAVRGLWPDRNPLRRTLDRVEAAVAGGLAVAFLAGAPLAALTTGHAVYRIWSRTADTQQAAWHQVPAVLTAVPVSGYGDGQVPARWRAPDGSRRTGTVPAPSGARAGRTVAVWVDAAGQPTGPPVTLSQARGIAALAAALACITVGFLVGFAGLLARSMLGRRRLAAWDADWQATEPQWTGRS